MIYLDNGATSFPKPASVIRVVGTAAALCSFAALCLFTGKEKQRKQKHESNNKKTLRQIQ